MYFWWCRCSFLSLLMKLMTGMTKWAVTIHSSGDSQGWAGFYAGQALTQSAAGEFFFFFFKVGVGGRVCGARGGDIRWQKNAYGKRMERKGGGGESEWQGGREGKRDSE